MILSACRRDSEEFMDDVDVTGLSLLLCQQSGEVLMTLSFPALVPRTENRWYDAYDSMHLYILVCNTNSPSRPNLFQVVPSRSKSSHSFGTVLAAAEH